MAKLQRFIPQTPDPYLKQADQLGAVKFGHLNALVDSINSTVYGDYLQLQGDGPMSTTLRALEDPEGNLAKLYLAIDKTAILGPLKVGDTTANQPSAILQIDSTSQGVLFPRMTIAERDAIVSPATGLIIYNSDDSILNTWDGTGWTEIGGGGLGLLDGALLSATLTPVVDKNNVQSPLQLSTDEVGVSKSSTATTQDTAVIQSTDTNAGIAIVPNGTGAITAAIPDGTAVGGNARGDYSVDLQRVRNNIDQVAKRDYSVITGGQNNWCDGDDGRWGFVGGGLSNRQRTAYGAIVGGQSNQTGDGNSGNVADFIGGGMQNVVFGSYSAIVAGRQNSSNGNYTSIGGGYQNTIANSYATVVGGSVNTSSGQYSVSGGGNNTASGSASVAFGRYNQATGDQSFTMGNSNYSTNDYAIAMGYANTSQGYSSIALGDRAFGYLHSQLSVSSGRFAANGDAQASQVVARKSDDLTTGGTTVLSLDGTGTTDLITPNGNNRAWNVKVETVATVTSITGTATGVSVGDTFMQDDKVLFKRVSGTSSVVGTNNQNLIADTSMGTASITYSAGASQELAITFTAPTFTGGGSVTCRVVSKVSLVEVAW